MKEQHMPEEGATAPENGQETPVTDAPETPVEGTEDVETLSHDELPEGDQVDWEKRYRDLQPTYTRTSQDLAEQRKRLEGFGLSDEWFTALESEDTDAQRAALNFLLDRHGYELPENEQDEEFEDDEPSPYLTREEWEAHQQEQQADERAAIALDVGEHVKELAKEAGIDVLDGDKLNPVGLAIAREAMEPWPPDHERTQKVFEGWVGQFDSYTSQKTEQYRESKRSAAPPAKGSSGSPEIDINDPAQRLARANEVAAQVYEQ